MRRLLSLAAVLAMLSLAACGDDEETTPAEGTTGATDALDSASGDFFTAQQFLDASLPDQVEEVETIVGITSECEGVKANEDFQVSVSIDAAQAAGTAPDTPLEDIVADHCADG